MGDAGYDYNRMSKYQRRRIDHAEALVKADERRRAARENPALAAVGTMVVKPFQFVDYAGAFLSGIGSSDPSDPKTYVPINTDTMDLTNAVNTVRGEQAKMAEETWGKPGSFAYQTGMSMADFLFTSGVTGNFSGGGKAASNLALGIMGSSAAADTTVSALNRGLSNRQALTLGAIAGAAEIITEKVSLEKLLDMTSLSKSRVGYVLQNIVAEGSEEAASDVINWVADVLVSRDRSEWRLAIAAYEAQGMDPNKAFLHALKDQALSIGLDALGGAISGGIMASGSVAIDAHQKRATGGWVNSIEGAKKPGEYRLNKPQNVEMPTVPIINLSVQDIPVQGDTLPTAGNILRSDAIQRARARLGLDKNSAAYIPASNVMRDGNEYVLKITKASLTKMLSPSTQGAIPVESILVMDNLERIANNGVWFESEGDRRGRQQIAGIDHLKTTVYIDGVPFEVDMRVRLVEEAPGKGVDNVLYYFTPDEVLTIRRVGTTPPTYGRRASILHSEDGPTLGAGTASPTDERRALTGESEAMPTLNDRVAQNPGGVNIRRSLPGDIPADIPPGLRKLYRLAQEMSTKPQPREIPQRPVQQSPQEILTRLAREITQGPQVREIPQRPVQGSGWNALHRLTQEMAQDPTQDPDVGMGTPFQSAEQYSRWLQDINAQTTTLDTVDKYREAEYNNSPEYQLLRGYAKAVEQGDISPLIGFDQFAEVDKEATRSIVGKATSTGVVIESAAPHCIARIIGQVSTPHSGMRQGISIEAVLDALQNPVKIGEIKICSDGDIRQTFQGKKAVVTISLRDKRLIQTNPTR